MRRGLLIFLLINVLLVTFLLHTVSTLLSLLIEDASADAIHRSELPAPNSTLLTTRPQLIPKIIHQTYINESIPVQWQPAQKSCLRLHPDYEYILWTDAKSRNFIREEYPWFLTTFDGYKHPIQRADAIRYFVLSHYGGVYIDLDDGCKRRLDPLLSYTAWVRRTIPTGISNDIMGCVPQHPFFLRVIDSLQGANQKWVLPYITIMASTGPLFLSVIWKKWMGEHSALQAKQGDWPGRVRVLLPDEYNKHAWSFFQTYQGSSWHGKDAKLIFWMGRNWMLLTAAGFMLTALVGLAGWWVYGRILLLGAKRRRTVHIQMESSKVGGSRGPLSRLWRMFMSISAGGETKPRVNYELVEQHDA
jgi:inositol phosphorylceramide mannosyltransferase catalytic subunit